MTLPTINKDNWFSHWFNTSFYHSLYAHRDQKEAADFVDELVSELQPSSHAAMLDLGCGSGRHCRQLATKGFTVTGVDLAWQSIREAKKSETDNLRFYRHDMRLPFGIGCYDYVFNFFTSFGYFKSRMENQKVIRNIYHSLKPGGVLVMDYMNVHYAAKHLVPSEEKEIDGVRYHLTRWVNDAWFFKKIVVEDVQSEKPFEYLEQVSKFDLDDFRGFLGQSNFEIQNVYGDYRLNEFSAETSPRLIILAKKTEPLR